MGKGRASGRVRLFVSNRGSGQGFAGSGPRRDPWTTLFGNGFALNWYSDSLSLFLFLSLSLSLSLSFVCQLPHAIRSLFLGKTFTFVRYTFSTLSYPSACRITILLDKNIQNKPANKIPSSILGHFAHFSGFTHESRRAPSMRHSATAPSIHGRQWHIIYRGRESDMFIVQWA